MLKTELTWRTRRPAEGYYSSEVLSPDNLPVRTFLPIGYEPNYPYPLLVFLHGHGSNEERALRLAPRLSRRNYVAIGLRGPHRVDCDDFRHPGFTWPVDGSNDSLLEDYVISAVEQTRRYYHIHSERIFLCGICEGAAIAYRLGLTFPEKLGGVISLNGTMPAPGPGRPLFRLPELRQLKVLIGHGIANSVVPLSLAQRDYMALYAAGLDVKIQTYPTTHKLHSDMLRDVNRWIQAQVGGYVC
jgi:phospholipase/carboxylesterase